MSSDGGPSEPARYHADIPIAVIAGSASAFAFIYDVHAGEILAYCRWRCLDAAEAEDLLSVVFLEAWRCHDRATVVDGSLRPWLLAIACNVLRNSARSRRRAASALQRFRAANSDLSQPDHADEVATAVTAAASRPAILDAFAKLSAKERAVADLVLVEGLDLKTAAAVLAIPEATAKSRLAEARRRLQRLLRTSELSHLHHPSGHQPGRRPTPAAVTKGTAS